MQSISVFKLLFSIRGELISNILLIDIYFPHQPALDLPVFNFYLEIHIFIGYAQNDQLFCRMLRNGAYQLMLPTSAIFDPVPVLYQIFRGNTVDSVR